jgi:hypothetical protein
MIIQIEAAGEISAGDKVRYSHDLHEVYCGYECYGHNRQIGVALDDAQPGEIAIISLY